MPPPERRVIADTIADHGIGNLLMVSGDAHMVSIDDGTYSDHSTSGAADSRCWPRRRRTDPGA